MAKTIVAVCVLVLLLNIISTSPVHANWFGKRGDDDILGYLLRQSKSEGYAMTDETAMMAIERVVMKWRAARKASLVTSTEN